MGSYPNWDNFVWMEYVLRRRLAKTFQARHLSLSSGARGVFGKWLIDPKVWDMPQETPAASMVKIQVKVKSEEATPTLVTAPVMEWDSDTETFVPASS